MSELLQAADAVGSLEKTFRSVFVVAEALRKIGDLEVAIHEAETKTAAARTEQAAAEAVFAETHASVAELRKQLEELRERADTVSRDTAESVRRQIAAAEQKANDIVKGAEQDAAAAAELVKIALAAHEKRMEELAAQEDSAVARLKEINDAIEDAKRRIGA